MGRCPICQAWNSLEEKAESKAALPPLHPYTLSQLTEDDEDRKPVGVAEFDRVMGGGLVSGSLVLLGGEPGVGKSTLLLQVADAYAKNMGRGPLCLRGGVGPTTSAAGLSPRHIVGSFVSAQ